MDTLLDRFLRYVKIESTAVEESGKYPSSPGQLEMGRLLEAELAALKLDGAHQDENGLVWATIPANVDGAPTVCFLAHVDTSPEYTAKNVKPIVHRNYDGRDIALPGDESKVIRVADALQLAAMKGNTLITTDGTTLLGADDKAGVAVIMTTAAHLMAHPEIKHGPIRILFTCDEEIGHGTDKIDLKKINAVCAYTLDSESEGHIESETFSADLAVVTITGVNIHPGFGQGRMVNSIRLAAEFIARMPWQTLAPEVTGGRNGFLHPYVLEGGVPEVRIRILLRSFVTAELSAQKKILEDIAATVLAEHPRAKITVDVKKQYRNMIEFLGKEPRAAKLAEEATRRAGLTPKFDSIRGGTDGSRLSEIGLPTPNLSVGMHNFHSPLEFACLEEMENSVKVLIELAQLWAKEK